MSVRRIRISDQGCGQVVIREHRFHHERAWRFDRAIPAKFVALEIEGLGGRGSVASWRT
jgi:hypothetical protein